MREFKRFAITPTHVCDMTSACPICRLEQGLTAAQKIELWEQRRAAEVTFSANGDIPTLGAAFNKFDKEAT